MRSLVFLSGVLFSATTIAAPSVEQVTEHYADLAHAVYTDAYTSAIQLREANKALLASPSEASLQAAKQAWLNARVFYQQSEVFRFGNPIVDDWEGQLNAWPLDEGLIDYVATDYQFELGNPGATANIIASQSLLVGEENIDLSEITPDLLASLNELAGSEANVASGYHAIEFLLWGQDLNGTNAGAGERPASDFAKGSACTNGNCERRGEYLMAASELLVDDLAWMSAQWSEQGDYRSELLAESSEQVLRRMLFGMGSLSLGELAGERMKVALEAASTEDEHDCFSDNTHNSHYYNAKGVANVYFGQFQRASGETFSGPSLHELVQGLDAQQALANQTAFANTEQQLTAMVTSAEQDGVYFDMLIAPDNQQGHELVNGAISALVESTKAIEQTANVLGVQGLNPDTADHEF